MDAFQLLKWTEETLWSQCACLRNAVNLIAELCIWVLYCWHYLHCLNDWEYLFQIQLFFAYIVYPFTKGYLLINMLLVLTNASTLDLTVPYNLCTLHIFGGLDIIVAHAMFTDSLSFALLLHDRVYTAYIPKVASLYLIEVQGLWIAVMILDNFFGSLMTPISRGWKHEVLAGGRNTNSALRWEGKKR